MTTIDNLLIELGQQIKQLDSLISKKDKKILISLSKQLSNNVFLTENQANLLKKILQENVASLKTVFLTLESTLMDNKWSKEFRIIKKVKKIYIDPENRSHIILEFNFNHRLKEKMSKILPSLEGQIVNKGTKYLFLATETNIDAVIGAFIKENFDIEENILNFYQEIQKIHKSSTQPFEIFSTTYEKLKNCVAKEIGQIEKDNILLLHDRKIQFQYEIYEKIEGNTLENRIAQRTSNKIYINPANVNFVDLVNSLMTLRRLPLMVIFEGYDSKRDVESLKMLEKSLKFHNMEKNVGIYFRYDNGLEICEFNKLIATLNYNNLLSEHTDVVGISNSKLPKFMLKSNWKPKSVISFTNSFRSNKTSVYCNDVDCIIYYTDVKPLDEKIHELL